MSGSQNSSPPPEKVDLSGNRIRKPNNGWTKEQEQLMAEWSDIAACYRWMHDKYEKQATLSNLWITVPVIVLSTLTGSASFVMNSLVGNDPEANKYAQIGIGGVSIFTGILTTLGNFFRYAQSSEANRVASISWGKFQRQIAIELALHPSDRIDSMDFLKFCRSELDRMIEQSPQIPDNVISQFEKEFVNTPNLEKPDIAHGIDHTKIFKDTDTLMKKMAADATMMLQQKRKVWHEAMMPDVDKRLDKKMSDLSGNFNLVLEEKLRALEEKIGARGGMPRALVRGTTSMRKLERVHVTFPSTKPVSPSQLIGALTESPQAPVGLTVSPAEESQAHTANTETEASPEEVIITVTEEAEADDATRLEEAEAVDSDTGDANEYSKKS
jgi:hypothetical protein